MATHAAVGKCLLENGFEAGRDAALAARAAFGGDTADLAIVFATAPYEPGALLGGVREALPGVRIVGCSGEGVITLGASDEIEHACGVMLLASDRMRFEPYLVEGYSDDSAAAGRTLASHVRAGGVDDLIALLVMPDGLGGDCTAFLDALAETLPAPVTVAGGAASDASVMERTWQYLDDRAVSGGVAALALRGRGRLDVSVSHGCQPLGLWRRVTRADGGWIQEIDGRPAWTVFKEYLDGDPEDLNVEGISHLSVGLPLGEGDASTYAPYIIRVPLRLDRDSGALFFPGGGLREGDSIRLTRRDHETIRASAASCARALVARNPDRRPAAVLQFDCTGRGRMLFGSNVAREIVEPLQREVGGDVPWLGFHTYGEVAPINGTPRYHNYTVVLCALYDRV